MPLSENRVTSFRWLLNEQCSPRRVRSATTIWWKVIEWISRFSHFHNFRYELFDGSEIQNGKIEIDEDLKSPPQSFGSFRFTLGGGCKRCSPQVWGKSQLTNNFETDFKIWQLSLFHLLLAKKRTWWPKCTLSREWWNSKMGKSQISVITFCLVSVCNS